MSDVSSGWGRFTWGQAYWNRDALLATGWGAKACNDGEWGNLADETVSLTGVSFSASWPSRGCARRGSTGSLSCIHISGTPTTPRLV